MASKENYWIGLMAIAMLTTQTDPSHLALHTEKSNFTQL